MQAWYSLRKWLGRVADILYLTSYIAYVCGSFLLVWYAVHAFGIASIPGLIAFIEQVRMYGYICHDVQSHLDQAFYEELLIYSGECIQGVVPMAQG